MNRRPRNVPNLIVEPFGQPVDPQSAVVSFCAERCPAILESSYGTGGYGRFSVFAFDPIDEFQHVADDARCPLDRLHGRCKAWPTLPPSDWPIPFSGGWIGYLGYETGHWTEPTRVALSVASSGGMPICRFFLYDTFAAHDRATDEWYIAAVEWPASIPTPRNPAASRLKRVRRVLRRAATTVAETPIQSASRVHYRTSLDREGYHRRFARAKRYIEAGDIYQVNLTRRFSATVHDPPMRIYQRYRRANPAALAAFLPWSGAAVISGSPELFLDLSRRRVVTRPIKGTAARPPDAALLDSARTELLESSKDRAELNMIIDLMRNDLGRVCSFGSVRVLDECTIENHPTVLHRVATVQGELQDGAGWRELLQATFPGGSITGAPKIRAMQIIQELEPVERGVYCGSIGWIGLDGSLRLSIAIRTMVQQGKTIHFSAGGAIVADSDVDAEFHETQIKAAGMMRAVGCDVDAAARVAPIGSGA